MAVTSDRLVHIHFVHGSIQSFQSAVFAFGKARRATKHHTKRIQTQMPKYYDSHLKKFPNENFAEATLSANKRRIRGDVRRQTSGDAYRQKAPSSIARKADTEQQRRYLILYGVRGSEARAYYLWRCEDGACQNK
ncbi:hypothetical protein BaRGS_00014756 [Batillaria attramentaria]|uniref:Uncharacterized protein n=1 Tax=Batillaria attramentaria TaxID=370345 RepID=A0ABD0L2V6_9CAEN